MSDVDKSFIVAPATEKGMRDAKEGTKRDAAAKIILAMKRSDEEMEAEQSVIGGPLESQTEEQQSIEQGQPPFATRYPPIQRQSQQMAVGRRGRDPSGIRISTLGHAASRADAWHKTAQQTI